MNTLIPLLIKLRTFAQRYIYLYCIFYLVISGLIDVIDPHEYKFGHSVVTTAVDFYRGWISLLVGSALVICEAIHSYQVWQHKNDSELVSTKLSSAIERFLKK